MKKTFLFCIVLFVAVFCSACINNVAIQELNNKAMEYLKNGDPQSAVCRLQASLDLDNKFFETNYNLSIAYIELKEWENAEKSIKNAINANPEFSDSYYTLGLIYENIALNIENNEDENIEDDTNYLVNSDNTLEKTLSDDDKEKIIEYLTKAIEAYNTYAEKTTDAKAKEEIKKVIDSLTNDISTYSEQDKD